MAFTDRHLRTGALDIQVQIPWIKNQLGRIYWPLEVSGSYIQVVFITVSTVTLNINQKINNNTPLLKQLVVFININ